MLKVATYTYFTYVFAETFSLRMRRGNIQFDEDYQYGNPLNNALTT